jgi:hypothetical protein
LGWPPQAAPAGQVTGFAGNQQQRHGVNNAGQQRQDGEHLYGGGYQHYRSVTTYLSGAPATAIHRLAASESLRGTRRVTGLKAGAWGSAAGLGIFLPPEICRCSHAGVLPRCAPTVTRWPRLGIDKSLRNIKRHSQLK